MLSMNGSIIIRHYTTLSEEKMRNIAIVTIYGDVNFGNKLQNYAVQLFFERLGYQATTIKYRKQLRDVAVQNIVHFSILRNVIHLILYYTKYETYRRARLFAIKERKKYIGSFSDQYIRLTSDTSYFKLRRRIRSQFDYFVSGSDQVWQPLGKNRHDLEYFFLAFSNSSQRLTIAPSFGFDEFPKKYLKTYKKGLAGFEYLSVREERGAELIKELTGKEATVLLDPTMLIETSEWLKILRKPSQYSNDKYVFVYALGGFKGDVKEKICKLADKLELKVIDIMDIDSDYYIHTRPDEFLYWIHNARLVVTDSFHAAVFSILFNRPFIVTERSDVKGMGSRLDTLFKKFGISGRHFNELKDAFDSDEEIRNRLFAVDYSRVSEVLDTERKKAEEFYKKCFHEKQ